MEGRQREFATFNTAKKGGKVLLKLKDIVYISCDDDGARNKKVIMKDGTTHVIMDCSMVTLLNEYVPHLFQPNRNVLISHERINIVGSDYIILDILNGEHKPMNVSLGRNFAKEFKRRLAEM